MQGKVRTLDLSRRSAKKRPAPGTLGIRRRRAVVRPLKDRRPPYPPGFGQGRPSIYYRPMHRIRRFGPVSPVRRPARGSFPAVIRVCIAPAICSARWCCSIPATPKRSASALGASVRAFGATVCLSPALGGIVIGQEVARALDVRAALRRAAGRAPDPAARVQPVAGRQGAGRRGRRHHRRIDARDDGGRRAGGARVVGACSIVDRSGGNHGLDCRLRRCCPCSCRPTGSRVPDVQTGIADREARIANEEWHWIPAEARSPIDCHSTSNPCLALSSSPSPTTAPTSPAGSGRPAAHGAGGIEDALAPIEGSRSLSSRRGSHRRRRACRWAGRERLADSRRSRLPNCNARSTRRCPTMSA